MDTALYFPYISVPKTPWFTQVLLYWDVAASIVPYNVRGDLDVLSPYMLELEQANLLHLMAPEETLGNLNYETFASGFFSLVDGPAKAVISGADARTHRQDVVGGLQRSEASRAG